MKKIVILSLFALCLPWTLGAQSVVDDLYYVPSQEEAGETASDESAVAVKTTRPTTTTTVVTTGGNNTTVIVRDSKGNVRDIDEYNRRYEASDYNFSQVDDTLYIDEKVYDGLDGEWVNGFDGTADDYEYATRIIRFRNPRFAVSISSPYYWDIVYGLNSWEWNIYVDDFYVYAFPTFSNRLWWDWRFNYWGWGYPYYSYYWDYWYGWYGPGWSFAWGGWWGHHHHPHYYAGLFHGGVHRGNMLTQRRGYSAARNGVARPSAVATRSASRNASVVNGGQQRTRSAVTRSSTSGNRRVVGTRSVSPATRGASTVTRGTATRANSTRVNAAESRRTTYTRPSSTRAANTRSSSASYVRGSSDDSGATGNSYTIRRSSDNSSNSSVRSYNSGTTRRSSSSFSTGGSSYRSGGVSGGGASRSSGGGSSRGRR